MALRHRTQSPLVLGEPRDGGKRRDSADAALAKQAWQRTVIVVLGLCLLLIAIPTCPANAFQPLDKHYPLTESALQDQRLVRVFGNETAQFSERARREIALANATTDYRHLFGSIEHFTDEKLKDASGRLVELRDEVKQSLLLPNPDGRQARKLLGTALHAIQDFYSHSNWVEIGNATTPYEALGRWYFGSPGSQAFCPEQNYILGGAGLVDLTTAYYPFFDSDCPINEVPVGKCTHGTLLCSLGIDKDNPAYNLNLHNSAAHLAFESSVDFVNLVIEDLGDNAKAIRELMDVPKTLAFVVDTSNVMSWLFFWPDQTTLAQVARQAIIDAVQELEGTPDKPDYYVLATFDHSETGAFVKTGEHGTPN